MGQSNSRNAWDRVRKVLPIARPKEKENEALSGFHIFNAQSMWPTTVTSHIRQKIVVRVSGLTVNLQPLAQLIPFATRNDLVKHEQKDHFRTHRRRRSSVFMPTDVAYGGPGSQLFRAMRKRSTNALGFIPHSKLFSIVTKDVVREELKRSFLNPAVSRALRWYRGNIEMVGDDDADKYIKIMAILLIIERPSRIKYFVRAGISDEQLPFQKVKIGTKLCERFELRSRSDPDTPLCCFKRFSQNRMDKFEQYQWAVLARVFTRDSNEPRTIPHYHILPKEITPLEECKVIAYPSNFSKVYRVKLHKDHHEFAESEPLVSARRNIFAVKRLISTDEKVFVREARFLDLFSNMDADDGQKHITALLATFQFNGKYHLVFPFAESDLLNYWKYNNSRPSCNDTSTSSWVLNQCQGLASALATIHRFCRHGDIKPANILWFPDFSLHGMGILKITDFGTAQPISESPSFPRTLEVPTTPMYAPPEACYPISHDNINTSFDIWSLGCVYLEFITWLLDGWKSVERFLAERLACDRFSYSVQTGAFFCSQEDEENGEPRMRVKASVVKAIHQLQSDPNCTKSLHTFLLLIQEHMLIVDEEARMNASGITERLAG